jgi:hypothetical protein
MLYPGSFPSFFKLQNWIIHCGVTA